MSTVTNNPISPKSGNKCKIRNNPPSESERPIIKYTSICPGFRSLAKKRNRTPNDKIISAIRIIQNNGSSGNSSELRIRFELQYTKTKANNPNHTIHNTFFPESIINFFILTKYF